MSQLNILSRGWLLTAGLIVVSSHSLRATPDFVPEASAYHAYVDSNILFAFELAPSREAFIEVINLGENRRCLSVDRITLRTAQGQPLRFDSFLYDGGKSKLEGNPRACVRQRTRRRFELGYSFEFPGEVRKVAFLVGRLAYRLQPVSGADYRKVVENFEKINIGVSSEHLKKFQLRVLFGDDIYGSRIRYRRVTALVCQPGDARPRHPLEHLPQAYPKGQKEKDDRQPEYRLEAGCQGRGG